MPETESAELKKQKRHRGIIKGQVTRILNSLNDTADFPIDALETRAAKLEEAYRSFSEVQLAIESEDLESDHTIDREQFECQYYQVSDLISSCITALKNVGRTASVTRNVDSPSTVLVKEASSLLPKIEIKPFDSS